jgi:hypothetical protein
MQVRSYELQLRDDIDRFETSYDQLNTNNQNLRTQLQILQLLSNQLMKQEIVELKEDRTKLKSNLSNLLLKLEFFRLNFL